MTSAAPSTSPAAAKQPAGSQQWPFTVTPLHPVFGCEISGLSIEEAASEQFFPAIYEAFLQYQLIVFRDCDMPPATQVALARRFGEVQVHVSERQQRLGLGKVALEARRVKLLIVRKARIDYEAIGRHDDHVQVY